MQCPCCGSYGIVYDHLGAYCFDCNYNISASPTDYYYYDPYEYVDCVDEDD